MCGYLLTYPRILQFKLVFPFNQLTVFNSLHATVLLSFSHKRAVSPLNPRSTLYSFLMSPWWLSWDLFSIIVWLMREKDLKLWYYQCFYKAVNHSVTIWFLMYYVSIWHAGPRGPSPARVHGYLFVFECCKLSERGPYDRLITRPDVSFRVWCVWVLSWGLDIEEVLNH